MAREAKRFVGAMLLAVPAAWIATAIGDSTKTPELIRALISPGMTLALHIPFHPESLLDAVGKVGMTALAINWLFYSLISYGSLLCISAFLPGPQRTTD